MTSGSELGLAVGLGPESVNIKLCSSGISGKKQLCRKASFKLSLFSQSFPIGLLLICNHNRNQRFYSNSDDDFKTFEGDVEKNPAVFAGRMRATSSCSDSKPKVFHLSLCSLYY